MECGVRHTLGFRNRIKQKPATRRGILAVISAVYDPLGLASPAILLPKMVLQKNFAVNRCVKPEDFGEPETFKLHHLSDPSEFGYGIVSYVRMVNKDGRIHCAFVMAKARVAPLSIPHMELTAATVAICGDRLLKQKINWTVGKSYFWTDDTTVHR
ncbi:uncharacterized protein LOC102808775 [Saccoglossus kowalevskii]|uniref:Uncharacterized protein LOC102808775 n=1 Tax=Saccoglossus kowalevskii TaxID=10224 RepID=A0ABM0LXN4_SACKO|nr:PREDICTED: uncharacterized protein LOC102808775 [Saccoglossus kowalevskii]